MSESLPKTRREKLEAREDTILTAAHDVFVEHGFNGTKMAEIARRADVAEGTLYLYFKNKNALLLAVVGKFYQRLTERAAQGVVDISDSFERLTFLAHHHLVSCLDEWRMLELVSALYRNMPEYESEGYYQFNKAYVSVFDNVVREAINRNEIRKDIPLRMIRDLFYGSLEYSARTHLLKSGPESDTHTIVGQLITILQQGVGYKQQPVSAHQQLALLINRLDDVTSRLEKTKQDSG